MSFLDGHPPTQEGSLDDMFRGLITFPPPTLPSLIRGEGVIIRGVEILGKILKDEIQVKDKNILLDPKDAAERATKVLSYVPKCQFQNHHSLRIASTGFKRAARIAGHNDARTEIKNRHTTGNSNRSGLTTPFI